MAEAVAIIELDNSGDSLLVWYVVALIVARVISYILLRFLAVHTLLLFLNLM